MDGGWGNWGPCSSNCPTDCLQERKKSRIRTRTCTNPAPEGDGNDCSGESTDQQTCGGKLLFASKYRKIVVDIAQCSELFSKFYL